MFNSKKLLMIGVAVAIVAGTGYVLNQYPAQASASEEGQTQAPQAMPVSVSVVKPEAVQIWKNFSARLEPTEYADIRPQVSGTISEVKFEDGQMVEKDTVLFVIDPRPYEAALNQAKAELKAAQNESSLARKELDRAKGLIETDAISKRIFDERQSASRVAWANVKRAEAMVETAQINYDYAHIKAPISGRLSRAEMKVGNLVEAGPNAPLLTSIIATDTIYADFDVDEQTYLTFVRSEAKGQDAERSIPVKLSLSGDDVEYKGFIDSFDNQIDSSTGTIRARALFDNEDGALLPGMFASVEIGSPSAHQQILVDERAISTDQDRKFVYVVDENSQVAYREIKVGESVDGKRVVTSGLAAGDKVISEGIIRVRPGMPVEPKVIGDVASSVPPSVPPASAEPKAE